MIWVITRQANSKEGRKVLSAILFKPFASPAKTWKYSYNFASQHIYLTLTYTSSLVYFLVKTISRFDAAKVPCEEQKIWRLSWILFYSLTIGWNLVPKKNMMKELLLLSQASLSQKKKRLSPYRESNPWPSDYWSTALTHSYRNSHEEQVT